MSQNVLEAIAGNYDRVKEGVGQFMGGNIIETEATRIYREGEKSTARQVAIRLYNMGEGYEKIASALDVDIRQVQRWIRKGRKMNQ